MSSYEKNLHKYDKIGDNNLDRNTAKPDEEVSRYAPGTLESNGPAGSSENRPYNKRLKDDDEEEDAE